MQQHILITKEMRATMPATTKIIFEVNTEIVTYSDKAPNEIGEILEGANAIVEDTKENIIAWLKPFKGVWVGNGVPQLEQFELMHIKDENDEEETS